ncbi:hypothetical protein RBWH47_01346 [Rhodopirellula baltica WH47]|uniref:Uncharacterized protein n=1 Tax=Rhodopirellula baltica WH47 TaxID=991778 RepID=F2AY33_RHOBT|nr:hypothetical protein RBWH47_01346 [Rhodopirellula baltica WH47]
MIGCGDDQWADQMGGNRPSTILTIVAEHATSFGLRFVRPRSALG